MEAQYGIVKAQPRNLLPETDILPVNHQGTTLVVRYPAFGPGTYFENIQSMQQLFYHSPEQPIMHFQPATTSESISIAAPNFAELAKPRILDQRWLQLGWIVRTSEGVFANPMKDAQGNPIVDEKLLKARLDNCKKVDGIYLGNNDFGFAPYESFKRGVQDSGDFAEGGLARLLEHTEERVAPDLKEMSNKKNYSRGVNVYGFDEVTEPVLKVAGLYSGRGLGGRFYVGGDGHGGDGGGGAFGVSRTGEASRAEK